MTTESIINQLEKSAKGVVVLKSAISTYEIVMFGYAPNQDPKKYGRVDINGQRGGWMTKNELSEFIETRILKFVN